MSIKKIIIITALPFRKQGNQSLMRFVKLFLSRGIQVTLYTSGNDDRGHNVLNAEKFEFANLPNFRDHIYNALKIIAGSLAKLRGKRTNNAPGNNYYKTIRSEDIFPPYGNHTISTLLNKWFNFLLTLADNFIILIKLLLFERKIINASDIIVGYEANYTFTAKIIARLYGKVYLNKYQGVVPLKACGENLRDCIKYYPLNYFGLHKSDLCLMVNDGTNGIYYAYERGCRSIYFEPHGIGETDYDQQKAPIDITPFKDKFIIFNNASNSKLKRTDRIIRSLKYIDEELQHKFILITTYHAEDLDELKQFTKLEGLEKNVVFLDKLNHKESNYLLRNAHLSIMTNEVSNLGNPVLESIYYKVPVLTIDDGSLNGFITNELDGFLVPLEDFDRKTGSIISRLISDSTYYDMIKHHIAANTSVNTLQVQQSKEFNAIETIFLQTTSV